MLFRPEGAVGSVKTQGPTPDLSQCLGKGHWLEYQPNVYIVIMGFKDRTFFLLWGNRDNHCVTDYRNTQMSADATWWAPFSQTPLQTKYITLAKDISALSNADAQDARGLACVSCVYLEHQLYSSSEMNARLVQYGDVTGSGVNKHSSSSSSRDNKLKYLVVPPVTCVEYIGKYVNNYLHYAASCLGERVVQKRDYLRPNSNGISRWQCQRTHYKELKASTCPPNSPDPIMQSLGRVRTKWVIFVAFSSEVNSRCLFMPTCCLWWHCASVVFVWGCRLILI